MAPFYSPSGIVINGNQTSSLNITGNGANYNNGTLKVDGILLTNGSITITAPQSLIIGQGQTLSEIISPPIIVQQVQSASQAISLPSLPAPGNLLLLIGAGQNISYPAYTCTNNFTLIAGQSDSGYYDGAVFAKIATGNESLITINGSGVSGQIFLFEITNFSGALPYGSTAEIGYSGNTPSAPILTQPAGSLTFTMISQNGGVSYNTPMPTGSTILWQGSSGGADVVLIQTPGNNSSNSVSISTSSTIGTYVYAQAIVETSTSVSAQITVP